jgi:8-oxo-dGTP pyrophosphatase MutT (NUDIX family)
MRTTKVMGFSVPPEIYKKVNKTIQDKNKTKSEFFREMISVYYNSQKPPTDPAQTPSEADLAKILESYWMTRAQIKEKVIIIALAIIEDNGKILIGAREGKDQWVDNLTWVFPGGKMDTLDFNAEIVKEVEEETGMKVKPLNLVAARVHPDSGFKDVQIVALYFHCKLLNGKQKKIPGGDLTKLKWVKPTEVFKYFTTSTCDDVTKFLAVMEKSKS